MLAAALLLAASVAASLAPSSAQAERRAELFRVGEGVYVRALAYAPRTDSLWVGASTGALEIGLDDMTPRRVLTRDDGLANEYVFALGLAPDGAVWFGTNAGGASRLRDGHWRTYFPMHGLADYWVYAFDFDAGGRAWIGTWDGASLYDPATDAFTTYHDELVNIWVYGLDIDPQGRVWFGTEGGVSMYDARAPEGRRWRAWTHADGLGAPNSAGLPPSDNTGLGTRARHDLSVTTEKGGTYNPDYVFAVHVDSQGRGVWFGTWGGGVSLYDGQGGWTSYTREDGLAGNIVYSIAQGPDGVLWFGTDGGVSSFDGARWTSQRQGLAGAHVYALAIDGAGGVWAGGKGGVARLAPEGEP